MLTACVTVRTNYVQQVVNYDYPDLNTQTTAYLGEEMLIQGRKKDGKALRINAPMGGICYQLQARDYDMIGDDGQKYFFAPGHIERYEMCDPYQALSVDRSRPNEVCVVTVFNLEECYTGSVEVLDTTDQLSPHHFQRTLYFSGLKGNEIELMYVEKSGLQTVMSHTVNYDVSKDPVIGYRGARIKIISYDKQSITYEVLRHFTSIVN